MPAGPLPLARRTALALGVAGIAVVSGCAEHTDAPVTAPTSDEDPDAVLVDSVVVELAGAEQVAVSAGVPDLAALHRAHIEALGGTPITPSPGRATLKALRRLEQDVQSTLVDSSMAAESGALARLLASMSAAVGQQLAALSRSTG